MRVKSKTFMNGRSQAIRLPLEFRFDSEATILITKIGDSLILSPEKKDPWATLKSLEKMIDANLDLERCQPTAMDLREKL